jgi:hypothetical protein
MGTNLDDMGGEQSWSNSDPSPVQPAASRYIDWAIPDLRPNI